MKHKVKRNSFTLLEILIVVGIISLLTAGAAVSYTQFNKQARDTRRKADLEQIRAALEMYRSDKGYYPCGTPSVATGCDATSTDSFGSNGQGSGWATNKGAHGTVDCYTSPATYDTLDNVLENGKYISNFPHDPLGGGCTGLRDSIYYGYMYYRKSAGWKSGYCLYAHLETIPAGTSVGCDNCLQGSIITTYHKNYCLENP